MPATQAYLLSLSFVLACIAAGSGVPLPGQQQERQQPATTTRTKDSDQYIRFGKRSNIQKRAIKENAYIRFGKRAPADYIRFGKRGGKDNNAFIRFGKKRAGQDAFIRFGKRRTKQDGFIRFGKRSPQDSKGFIRFGKRRAADDYIRFGKRDADGSMSPPPGLAPCTLDFLAGLETREDRLDHIRSCQLIRQQAKRRTKESGYIRFGKRGSPPSSLEAEEAVGSYSNDSQEEDDPDLCVMPALSASTGGIVMVSCSELEEDGNASSSSEETEEEE